MGLLTEAGFMPVPHRRALAEKYGYARHGWYLVLQDRKLVIVEADELHALYSDGRSLLGAKFARRFAAKAVKARLLAKAAAKRLAKSMRNRRPGTRAAVNRSLARFAEAV